MERSLLRSLEESLELGRESMEKISFSDAPSPVRQVLKESKEGALVKFDVLLGMTRAARKRLLSGETMFLDEFLEDFSRVLTPSSPLANVLLKAVDTVVSILVFGWLWSLLEVDPWRYCHMPDSLSSWIAWTVPYAVCTLVFWQDWFFKDSLPIKGYKLSQCSIMEEDITPHFLMNASFATLSLEILLRSSGEVFKNQGCYYGAMSAISLGPVENVFSMPDNFVGTGQQLMLPKALRSIKAVGLLGLLLSFGSILEDPTLSTFWLKDETYLSRTPPLSNAGSSEGYKLLTEPQVMEGRRAFTALLGGIQGIYLASEMLATNSLYTSICTSSIGIFIFSQAVKRTLVAQKPS